MPVPGEFTRQEIFSQPEAWTETIRSIQAQALNLRQFYETGEFDSVLYTGCGSTFYLSLAAAALFQAQTGVPARGLPASEIWLTPASAYSPHMRHLLVAVSRSGATTETLRAVEGFRKRDHGKVLTISCYPEAPLAKAGDLNLVFPAGQEQSVAQTRSFSSLYTACTALAMIISGQEDLLAQMSGLPAAGGSLLDRYAGLAGQLGRDPRFDRFYFLGSAARYGLASEVSLKMKEMSLSHSEPFRFLEFRHGPMSMVTESSLIVGLVSDENTKQETLVLEEMAGRGAEILSLGEKGTRVSFQSGLHPTVRNVLYLPILQLVAFEHSLAKGLNPDLPHNLTAVVRLI